ncbi:MAG: FAD-dependent oxidoreductase [Deltaproteobacteria bacterium]|nr:FAD-dependent oxidoreductase [Deltaproteobacteria bacterium]
MRFVVIGGDAAGMSAASRAKRNLPQMDVTVLEQTEDVSYSACGMPYNIADPNRDMDDLVVRSAPVFREKQGIDLKTGHRVEAIEPGTGIVRGQTAGGTPFELRYDKLLIATGASAIIPDLPGFELPGVLALKSMEDGKRIKQFIRERQVEGVVILGMGYIALEMAEALQSRGIKVKMVKPRLVFLPRYDEQLASMVTEELAQNDVEIYPGHSVSRIEDGGSALTVVCQETSLKGQLVLVSIGVRPNSQIADDAGIELSDDNAIAVDRSMMTSHKGIYAAGDCADAYHVVTGRKTWIPLALRANRGGWAVADHLSGRDVALQGIAGTAVFKVFNLQVASTGLNGEEARNAGFDSAEVIIKNRSRAHAHSGSSTIAVNMVGDRKSGRLLGVHMVGKEGVAHRINAPAVALHAGMTVEAFSQCDLAYAPPFGPVWDPMLTAANQLLKKI